MLDALLVLLLSMSCVILGSTMLDCIEPEYLCCNGWFGDRCSFNWKWRVCIEMLRRSQWGKDAFDCNGGILVCSNNYLATVGVVWVGRKNILCIQRGLFQ